MKTYYFNEDTSFSHLANQAKDLFQLNDIVAKIFEDNDEEIFGDYPSKILIYLKSQNTESIFSPSQSDKSRPTDSKSYQGLSTAVSSKPDISTEPRRHWPIENTVQKEYNVPTLETSTAVRRQTVIVSPGNRNKPIPILGNQNKPIPIRGNQNKPIPIRGLSSSYEEYVSPTDSPETPDVGNQTSSHSAKMSKPTKNFTVAEKELDNSEKVDVNINLGNWYSPVSGEVTRMSLIQEVNENMSRIHIQKTDDSLVSKDLFQPEENVDKSDNTESKSLDSQKAKVLKSQNTKSIFSPSRSDKSRPTDSKSYQRLSTAVSSKPDISIEPRRHWPIENTVQKEYNVPTLETSTAVRRQTVIMSPGNQNKPNPIRGLSSSDEQYVSPTDSPENPDVGNQTSSHSAKMSKTTKNFTVAEKELDNSEKVDVNINLGNSYSPVSGEVTRMTLNQEVNENMSRIHIQKTDDSLVNKDLFQPEENVDNSDNSESTINDSSRRTEGIVRISIPTITGGWTSGPSKRYKIYHSANDIQRLDSPAEITRKAGSSSNDNLTVFGPMCDDKLKKSPNDASIGFSRDEIKSKSLPPKKRNTQSFMDDKLSKSPNDESNIFSRDEIKRKSIPPKRTYTKTFMDDKLNKSPSDESIRFSRDDRKRKSVTPRKRNTKSFMDDKLNKAPNDESNIFSRDEIERKSLPPKKTYTKTFMDDKLNKSPSDESNIFSREERKRKSLTPKRRNTKTFRWLPKLIQLDGKTKIAVEVPSDSEDNASPTTSQSSPAELKFDSTKHNPLSPVVTKLKSKSSPTIFNFITLPETSISSVNVSATNSQGNGNVSAEKDPSGTPSTAAMKIKGKSDKSVASSAEADSFVIYCRIMKFNSLLWLRNKIMYKLTCSSTNFTNGIKYLNRHVQYLDMIVNLFSVSHDLTTENFTNELKEIVNDLNENIKILILELQSLQIDADSDVDTWHKYLQKYKLLREEFEALCINQYYKPLDVLQVYEPKMRAIWKEMDSWIEKSDNKRAALFSIAFNLDQIFKKFAKCLILVGILQPV